MQAKELSTWTRDVITFDTTHKTNSKRMPLAMFVGANNNLKNVTFG
jgi:hypothetical protein